MIKVIMVDDDKLILQSLKITLAKEPDIEVIGVTSNGHEVVAMCKQQVPNVILMDIQMPAISGIETTRLVKAAYPGVLIMMLTTFADQEHIKDAMAAGASGYLLKTDPLANLAPRLRLLTSGTGVMSADALAQLAPKENPMLKTLTPRELDIARLVAEGLTNKEIAGELYLTEGTIRNNLVIIMEKMQVSNRLQLGVSYYK